jgi:hypothetical protein
MRLEAFRGGGTHEGSFQSGISLPPFLDHGKGPTAAEPASALWITCPGASTTRGCARAP